MHYGLEVVKDERGASFARFVPSTVKEVKAYEAIIRMDQPKCPKCDLVVNPTKDKMYIDLPLPAASIFGMDLVKLKPACQKCGELVELEDEFDVNPAFPSIMLFLREARSQQGGGSNG